MNECVQKLFSPKIVSNSVEEGVILNSPSSTASKKQEPARIHWFFTLNNYKSEDINILKHCFNDLCYMYAFQEETGKNGTPHLQGVISLKKRGRWTQFGLMKEIHWEKVRNVKESYVYCTKEETRSGNVYLKEYTIPYTFKLTEFFKWQRDILDIIIEEPDSRKVNWYWEDKGGIGKSTFCKHLCMNHGAILLNKGKFSDICNLIYKANMDSCKVVIFDLPRNNGNKVSYDAIESIKNGMIVNMKFETGFKCFKPPHIIVFANEEPEYECLSEDRWNVKNLT